MMREHLETEVLVIGCGIAGGVAALQLADAGVPVTLVTRAEEPTDSNTYWAQGGIVYRGIDDSDGLLSEDVIRATVTASWDDVVWTPAQSALIRLCDELHETSSISDPLWTRLQEHFSDDQIVELIYTVGVYHTVSYLTNGLRIQLEEFGERFPL